MTLIIQEIGYKEIYPFSGWKLFTIPAAGEKEGIVYVYGEKIERNEERAENIKKLLIFAKDTRPEFQKYLLYKETYNPREIGSGKVNLYKKLITGL